jgi:HEAT repeat protein
VDPDPFLDRLLQTVLDGPDEARSNAAALLLSRGETGAPTLVGLLRDPRAPVRTWALETLHAAILTGRVEVRSLTDEAGREAPRCLLLLAELPKGDGPLGPRLVGWLQREEVPWRQGALAELLGHLAEPSLVPELAALVASAGESCHPGLCHGITRAGGGPSPEVRALLAHPRDSVRCRALDLVARLGDQGALPAVVSALEDPQVGVQARALGTLFALSRDAALPLLRSRVDAFDSAEDLVTWLPGPTAVLLLGEAGEAEDLPRLVEALERGPFTTVKALARHRHPGALDTLAGYLSRVTTRGQRVWVEVLVTACRALAERGTGAHRPALESLRGALRQVLSSRKDRVLAEREVTWALGCIARRERAGAV